MEDMTQSHAGPSVPQRLHAFITGEERLTLWRKLLRGMWKDRQPNPGEELERLRAEWDRDLPPLR